MGAHDGSALLGGAWPTPDTGHERINRSASSGATDRPTIALAAKLWMTPTTQSAKGVDYQRVSGKNVLILDGQAKALMKQWPTPMAQDAEQSGSENAGMTTLHRASQQWQTPASRDFRTPNNKSLQERGQGTKGEQLPNFVEHHFSHQVLSTIDGRPLSPTGRTLPRRLNPAFACWLMGWPIWWTNPALTSCVRSEMALYRSRLQWHLSSYFGGLSE